MSTVLKVENVSKLYRLGEVGTGTIAHDLKRWWHRVRGLEDPFAKIGEVNDRATKGSSEYVWALNDINFDVKDGEVLGIIGKNGAGKSTLLKLLSRVTVPTTGKIKVKGRVASLLEVGTGFHPELTGRDNIYLNGAILGMTKDEIRRKFDEIVDFSGVERYLDTPVKRYSSGMYVRLAFAVAAHLEPEILIVDEVLAVGDAEFQKKCLGKMKDVSGQGRTVLFVSHNMAAVISLCNKSILLERGGIISSGSTSNVVNEYLKQHDITQITYWRREEENIKNTYFKEVQIELHGNQPNLSLEITFKVEIKTLDKAAFVAFDIKNSLGNTIMQAIPNYNPFIHITELMPEYKCVIQLDGLIPDNYILSAWIGPHYANTYDYLEDIVSFEIVESPVPDRTFAHTIDHGNIVPVSFLKTN